MAEPTIPAGATVAAFVMTIISWYGMLRTGVQLIHNDIAARESADEDIRNMFIDLKHQENCLNDWRKLWIISKYTPNAVLLQYWGAARLEIINEKLKRIEADFARARKQLKGFSQLDEGRWKAYKKARRTWLIQKFIWTKKAFVQELIDRCPKNMSVIKDEADSGWSEQKSLLDREITLVTPYHIQVAHLLVQIATRTRNDVDALRTCCQLVQVDFAIILDLDIFDVVKAVTKDTDAARIAEVSQAEHLILDLLLREADRPDAELIRVTVERSRNGAIPESRIYDAFKAILDNQRRNPHFTSYASTQFGLSKTRRPGDPCSKLRHTFRDVLARQYPLSYNEVTRTLVHHELVLGELSTLRAAFELAQACLLFLRTTCLSELCRCSIRCEALWRSPSVKWYQFGLEMGGTTHQTPLWRSPYDPTSLIEGELADSWCANEYDWDTLNKPLRHLGLLLIELTLGTIVVPRTVDSVRGAASVTAMEILVKSPPSSNTWKSLDLHAILTLVKSSVHDSDLFAEAVEYCLTGSFSPAPSDAEWERNLRRFYFRVVKPYVPAFHLKYLY
jgi:hypothetical protein